ncbi:hypothetical protein [Sinorhizobium fredii]|uniref:hypothetical protein n=1 Tax=Rhizobium fredii TaxID=380 RepID=UPI00059C459E|nr:hypothetical protein [Sinorhizobium fredii]
MAIFDLFSKRQKRQRGEVPDIYTYAALPNPLRVQIVHIFRNGFDADGYDRNGSVKGAFKFVVQTLCEESGVFVLPPATNRYSENWEAELID